MNPPADDLPFSYIDIQGYNPWWEDETALPAKTLGRTDLYWRVKNTLENDLVLIPGAAATGTNNTLMQVIRALVLGPEHEATRIQELFADDDVPDDIRNSGYKPGQICHIPCSDPLAHLVDDLINEIRQAYHPRGARTGEREFYLFLEDLHRIDNWQEQLRDTYTRVKQQFPEEDWTIVASMPVARLAHDADLEAIENVEVDLPHHTQKYRDTLFSQVPELRTELRPAYRDGTNRDKIERARSALRDAAKGNCGMSELQAAFTDIETALDETIPATDTSLEVISHAYLTEGGFAPALQATDDRETTYPVSADAVRDHVTNGLATTLYQDVPRLAKIDSEIPRVDAPEDLHALIAYLARREFTETTYIDLGEFLSCDTRTIRQKFVPILEQLHIGERSTRYDLERNRTLRFYLRSPGYLTAFRNKSVTDADRTDRLRILIADHLRRLLANIGDDSLLQYWRDDDHLVDYIFDVDGNPILFISGYTDQTGGTVGGFDAFASNVTKHNLEVVISEAEDSVSVTQTDSNRLQLRMPHWVLLAVC